MNCIQTKLISIKIKSFFLINETKKKFHCPNTSFHLKKLNNLQKLNLHYTHHVDGFSCCCRYYDTHQYNDLT